MTIKNEKEILRRRCSLDGFLELYSGWRGPDRKGRWQGPAAGAIDVNALTARGFNVQLYVQKFGGRRQACLVKVEDTSFSKWYNPDWTPTSYSMQHISLFMF